MAITRANVEAALVKRASKKMLLVGFAVTVAGSNADLNDPIGTSLLKMGKSVSNISQVSDTDLLGISADEVPEFLDRVELRLLESISGNIDTTNVTVGPRTEALGQLADQCEKAIARLVARMGSDYGIYGSLVAGVIVVDRSEKRDDYMKGDQLGY